MAEILIKGIEMPKGNDVFIVDSAGTITKLDTWTGKREATDPLKVKAQELSPHGELKNTTHITNELEKQLEIEKRIETPFSECPPGGTLMRRSRIDVLEWVIRNIEAQPTVIEASKETE